MKRIIEEKVPLRNSMLWSLQRLAYEEFGPKSWSEKGVPYQITSNPLMAKACAEIAATFLEAGGYEILELGGGSGKFAFLFLLELLELTKRPFCYFLTDLSQKNCDFWATHPKFQPHLTSGQLKLHCYDPLSKIPDFLETERPLVIGHYFFDTLPQDLFRVEKGKLFQGEITLYAPEACSLDDPALIDYLEEEFNFTSLHSNNPILKHYAEHFERATFLLPTGAFQTMANLPPHALYLIGDKGPLTDEEISTWEYPKLDLHGAFSFPVNFHSLALNYSLLPPNNRERLFSLYLLSNEPVQAQIKRRFIEVTSRFNPQKAFERIQKFHPKSSADFANALQELGFDPAFYLMHSDNFEIEDSTLSDKVKKRLFPLSEMESTLYELLL